MISNNSTNSTFSNNEFDRQSQHLLDITNDRRQYEIHEETEQQEEEIRQYRKNEHVGEPMNRKSAESTRFYCKNVNGLDIDRQGGDITEICTEMQKTETDILLATEPGVCHKHHWIGDIIRKTARKEMKHSLVALASSRRKYKSYKKPGGSMMIAHGRTRGRITASGTDEYGRWSWMRLNSKLGGVMVLSAYQVGDKLDFDDDGQKGRKTARLQQHSMLKEDNRVETPREAFRKDLIEFLLPAKKRGDSILIMGDFNEVFEGKSGMMDVADALGMIDLLDVKLGTQKFGTHVRNESEERIDYALGSPRLVLAIRQCGYEPFGRNYKGDHRGFYIDFDTKKLFGTELHELMSPSKRGIHSKDKKNRARYVKAKYEELLSHNFFERLRELYNNDNPDHPLAERLDKDWLRASLIGDKRCAARYDEPFTKEIADLRIEKSILQKLETQEANNIDMEKVLNEQLSRGAPFLIPQTREERGKRVKEIRQTIRKRVKDVWNIRKREQKAKMEEKRKSKDKQGAKALRKIIAAEENAEVYRKLNGLKDTYDSQLNRIMVPVNEFAEPKECTEWRSVELPNEIEAYLLRRNKMHFGQAKGSFPTVPPFSDHVDWAASTYESELILEGDYSEEDIQGIGKIMIEHMKATTKLDSVDKYLTEDEWVGKLKVWRESTTTSPSKMHLGHHKSLIYPFNEDDMIDEKESRWKMFDSSDSDDTDSDDAESTEAKPTLEDMRKELLAAQLMLMNYAIKHEYVYDRWLSVVNMMILKEEGNTKVHRLRVLHLYEADYNLLLGVKWRKLMHHAVDNNLLHDSQYGGVPGRDSITPVLITEMQYEITRATRKALVTLDFDATSCYDRIIESVASLAARSYGQNKSLCFIHASHLREARYLLKTQMGVSTEEFKHSRLFPIYGTGQGSANSPVIWCLISNRLFEAHETHSHGATFQSPDGQYKVQVNMIGFVDDTYSAVNMFDEKKDRIEEILKKAQFDAQLWSDLLNSSGGALELPKVKFHVIHFGFDNTGKPVMLEPEEHHRIEVDGNDGDGRVELRPLGPHQARKMLGCHKEPSGTNKQAFEQVELNAMKKAKKVYNSHLDHRCVWRYYHGIFLPSVMYSFPVNSIKAKYLDKLQDRTTRMFLPKLGYNRNTPKAVVYGPSEYAGIDFRIFRHEQGLAKVETMLKHWRSTDTEAKKHLQIALAWNQYTAGTGKPILEDTKTKIEYLDTVWYPDLRDFLAETNSTIEVDDPCIVPVQRENDRHIMDFILSLDIFKRGELRRINYCRLYLDVHTISDIATACGRFLSKDLLSGNTSVETSQSKGKGVVQDRPTCKRSWQLWRRACTMLCSNKRTKRLCDPLGHWIVPYQELRRQWPLYSKIDDRVYVWSERSEHYFSYGRINLPYRFTTDGLIDEPPPFDACPIDFRMEPSNTFRAVPQSNFKDLDTMNQPGTYESYIESLPDCEREMLRNVTTVVEQTTVAELLDLEMHVECNTTPIGTPAASDGSVIGLSGTYGWIISLKDKTRIASCRGKAYGYPMTSHRAEAYGMWSILLFIIRVYEFGNKIPLEVISLVCDNSSLVDTVNKIVNRQRKPFPNETLQPDWDIINEIVSLLKTSKQSIEWIKGHQDEKKPKESLPLPAQLNCEADELANAAQEARKLEPLQRRMVRPPNNPIQVHVNNVTVTSKVKRTLRRLAKTPDLVAHIQKKAKWEEGVFNTIDWGSHKSSVQNSTLPDRFVTKFIHDLLPTGRRVHFYKTYFDHRCPSCFSDQEDRRHLLLCDDPERKKWKGNLLTDIRETCDRTNVSEEMLELLYNGIRDDLDDTPLENPAQYPAKLMPLIEEQDRIGWDHLLLGRFSKQWKTMQYQSLIERNIAPTRSNSGTGWIKQLTTVIWKHVYKVWLARNLARHGKEEEEKKEKERQQCLNEISIYYTYRDEGKLLQADTVSTMFYASIQEHLYRESTLHQLDTWLCTYRTIILQSKTQAAHNKKEKEKAIKASKTNITNITNSPPRRYQTRQERRRQATQTLNTHNIESNSDTSTSSEVSSSGDSDSSSSDSYYSGEEEDSKYYSGGSISPGSYSVP